jgi:hypothetical protein
MNTQQIELLHRIQEFQLDNPDSNFSFSQRLARENGWTVQYAKSVINEYKKFIFLAVIAEHPVTPSDQVDQVWHLHLSYSRSYWEEFCSKVLQQPLHHQPTRGLKEDQENFPKWYSKTLTSYAKLFQTQPPADIWPQTKTRFSRDAKFRRVNSKQHWVIPKPSLSLPRLPSFYLPQPHIPLMKLMAIALLFFILALVSMSLISQTKEIAALQADSDTQLSASKVTKNPSQSSKSIASNPESIHKSSSEQRSQLINWTPWIVLLVTSIIGSLGGNGSYSNDKNDSDSSSNNSGCSGCGCM